MILTIGDCVRFAELCKAAQQVICNCSMKCKLSATVKVVPDNKRIDNNKNKINDNKENTKLSK